MAEIYYNEFNREKIRNLLKMFSFLFLNSKYAFFFSVIILFICARYCFIEKH